MDRDPSFVWNFTASSTNSLCGKTLKVEHVMKVVMHL
jgi:hypothetical protein